MVIHHFNRIIRNKWVWGVFAVTISIFFAFDFLFTGNSAEEAENRRRDDFSDKGFTRADRALYETACVLGLEASDAEVRETILRMFSDPKVGGFDMRTYEALLRQNGFTPERFEALQKRRVSINKLRGILADATRLVSPVELDMAVNDMTDIYKVRVITFSDKHASATKLSDKLLKEYYDANTNSLALPECVQVRYVVYKADDAKRLALFNPSEDEMKDHYDATTDKYTSTGTNGVEVTKKFEEVKDQVKRELQLLASVEAYRTNLLFRAYPSDGKVIKGSRLDAIAKADKNEVKTSGWFSTSGDKFVKGLMVRPYSFAPDASDLVSAVAELDSESEDLRYAVVSGKRNVYLIEKNAVRKAHVPSFEDAKSAIGADALAFGKAKAFKASVDKTRALVAAQLANGKDFNPKAFVDANVSTSIVFSVANLDRTAFQDANYVAMNAMKLKKGQLSEFVPTAIAGHGIVIYLEDRKPGDAAQAQMIRPQLRDELGSVLVSEIQQSFLKSRQKALNLEDAVEDVDDGEVPQE